MRWLVGILSFCFGLVCFAQQASIHLQDGSTLHGDIIGFDDGSYRLRGESFGTIDIPQRNVRSIDYGDSAGGSSSFGLSELQAIQARIMMDPQLLESIQALASDPLVQDLVNDPEIQQAIRSGNYSGLMNNPKILRLMQNPSVRAITEQVR